MKKKLISSALLGLPLITAACGDFPRPFANNPGEMATRLSVPPPSRLAVPVPTGVLLPQQTAALWASATAKSLTDAEMPSFVPSPDENQPTWKVALSIDGTSSGIIPTYKLLDADGKLHGTFKGDPVPPFTWEAENKDTLLQATATIGSKIADTLTSLEAAKQAADPHSLLNRPPRVALLPITGAPGDGDEALTKQIKIILPRDGATVQTDIKTADYVVQCKINLVNVSPAVQRIEMVWIVTDAMGREDGRVAQLHDIQAGSLDHYWGDVAAAAAAEAAGGIKKVMDNQLITHRRHQS